MKKKKIIVFDFDKTLTYQDTILPFFRFIAQKNVYYPFKVGIYYFFMILNKLNLISNFTLKDIGIKLFLKGIDKEQIEKKSIEFSKKIKFNNLFKRLSFNENNYKYFVITASFEDYVKPIFPKNVKVIGSKIKYINNTPVGLLFNCYGEEKLYSLKSLNINEIDILYTDSLSDLYLAKIAKKIYIVKKDKIFLCNGVEEFIRFFKHENTNV